MANRYTNTDKWVDNWFSELSPLSKLLFMYLCDQCDIAGFLEVNIKTIAFELGTDRKSIEKAFVELCPDDKQEIKKASREEAPPAPPAFCILMMASSYSSGILSKTKTTCH